MAAADPFDELFAMAEADGAGVMVGVLEGAMHTDAKGRRIPVAEYAYYNEYGTQTIPARAAFRATADNLGDDWAIKLTGDIYGGVPAQRALTHIGREVADAIKMSIDKWTTPSNAPATIKRKRSKSDNPLVDSGDLLASIEFALTRGGD